MAAFRIIDDDTRGVIRDALDSFLAHQDDGGLGRTCLVVYPPRNVRCDNCVFDPVNNRSSNRPLSGGPVPFAAGGVCPLCSGKGLRQEQATEELTLKCTWEFKRFISPPSDLKVRLPYSLVEVKGYMADLPKLLKAAHIVVNLPMEPFLRQAFTLLGEPGDPSAMVSGRYFYSYWERKK